jgi:hypothetical protein
MKLNNNFLPALYALLLLGLCYCDKAARITINGSVKDTGGAGVSEATIQIQGIGQCCALDSNCTYQTDSSGNWSITTVDGSMSLSCTYVASKSGYTASTGTVQASPCQSQGNGVVCQDQTVTKQVTLGN